MDEVLHESLQPVLRDLIRAGLDVPRFEDWGCGLESAGAIMWTADGGGSSMSVERTSPLAERIAQAADQVQEWAIEGQLWGSAPTNWPPCPRHPDSHPMQASVVDSAAVWTCPRDGSMIARVGGD